MKNSARHVSSLWPVPIAEAEVIETGGGSGGGGVGKNWGDADEVE